MFGPVGQAARIVANDADDVLLVFEGKLLLDRLAVPRRHREVVDPHRVGDAAVGEKREGLSCSGPIDPADPVVVTHADAGHVGERLLALGPAVARDDHPGILVDDIIFLAELDRGRRDFDPGPPRLAEGLGNLL